MTFEEVMKLPIKERGAPMHELAKAEDDEACVAFAKLVFEDKFKGVVDNTLSKEDAKAASKAVRSDALNQLLNAGKRGYLPAITEGQDAAFLGRRGAFSKVFCPVNYKVALEFYDLWLTHDTELKEEDRALLLMRKATCLRLTNLNNIPWDQMMELWKEGSTYKGIFAVECSVKIGTYYFDNGRYEEAIPWLKAGDSISITAVALLLLIYKNHVIDKDLYASYLELCEAMCQRKG